MISFLSGKTLLVQGGFIILEVSGVGYRVNINDRITTKPGEKIELFTYNHIREDCNDLYGFCSYEELLLFEKLITVNGVGPKVGQLIMASSSADKIISAIIEENIAFFQAVPGIGKKVAAKIILDLKSKLSGIQSDSIIGKMNDSDELIEALASLGYKPNEIRKVVVSIPKNLNKFEDKVRWCIKNIQTK